MLPRATASSSATRAEAPADTAFARAVVGEMGGPDYLDVMAAFDAALERTRPTASVSA